MPPKKERVDIKGITKTKKEAQIKIKKPWKERKVEPTTLPKPTETPTQTSLKPRFSGAEFTGLKGPLVPVSAPGTGIEVSQNVFAEGTEAETKAEAEDEPPEQTKVELHAASVVSGVPIPVGRYAFEQTGMEDEPPIPTFSSIPLGPAILSRAPTSPGLTGLSSAPEGTRRTVAQVIAKYQNNFKQLKLNLEAARHQLDTVKKTAVQEAPEELKQALQIYAQPSLKKNSTQDQIDSFLAQLKLS